jgi:hypothetical protein
MKASTNLLWPPRILFFASCVLIASCNSIGTTERARSAAKSSSVQAPRHPPQIEDIAGLYAEAKLRTAAEGSLLRIQYQASRCVTPRGICWLQGFAPPGSNCWCATPYGPVSGRVG